MKVRTLAKHEKIYENLIRMGNSKLSHFSATLLHLPLDLYKIESCTGLNFQQCFDFLSQKKIYESQSFI